jgi:hypothetical protein
MQRWQTTYLGMRELPRDISGFELQAFFSFSRAERELIGARRCDSLKLAAACGHRGRAWLSHSGSLAHALWNLHQALPRAPAPAGHR